MLMQPCTILNVPFFWSPHKSISIFTDLLYLCDYYEIIIVYLTKVTIKDFKDKYRRLNDC